MHKVRLHGSRSPGDNLSALAVHGIETLPAALEQDADKIDDRVRTARRRLHRFGIAQIGLHGMDLADAAERLQVAREMRPAYRDPHAIALLRQRTHDMAAEKPEPPNTVTSVSVARAVMGARSDAPRLHERHRVHLV
jgi:hypothetical protein